MKKYRLAASNPNGLLTVIFSREYNDLEEVKEDFRFGQLYYSGKNKDIKYFIQIKDGKKKWKEYEEV